LDRIRRQIRLRLNPAISSDVQQLNTTLCEYATYQQTPVASRRIFLAACDRDAVLPDTLFETADTFEECRRPCEPGVQNIALGVVELALFRSPTQLLPEIEILDPRLYHRRLEHLRIEVRRVPRVGMRAYVNQNIDAVHREKADKLLKRLVRMTDREEARHQVRQVRDVIVKYRLAGANE